MNRLLRMVLVLAVAVVSSAAQVPVYASPAPSPVASGPSYQTCASPPTFTGGRPTCARAAQTNSPISDGGGTVCGYSYFYTADYSQFGTGWARFHFAATFADTVRIYVDISWTNETTGGYGDVSIESPPDTPNEFGWDAVVTTGSGTVSANYYSYILLASGTYCSAFGGPSAAVIG